jgi:hypothetical protein
MHSSRESSSYRGPERRRRVTYMTRNTEYHLESGVCVAVRDRNSGNWQLCHGALGRRLSASVRRQPGHAPSPSLDAPALGDALFFGPSGSDGSEVLTSSLQSIERPQKTTIDAYPV